MNAKELRDNWNNFGHDIRNLSSESNATILRALDLLAATEGSTDEIVRELRGQHCRDFGSDPQCDADGLCICAMHERAAAALVAERAAKEKAEAERKADLDRSFWLGQTYWQQADSESYAQNRKSAETMQKFRDLRDRASQEKP